MNFSIECEEETDVRWLAEVPQLPGVLCYGQTAKEARIAKHTGLGTQQERTASKEQYSPQERRIALVRA
jgi:predicted RNase H-like HicB family nuclease